MADSRRVFVQLGKIQNQQLHMMAPVMAFVTPTDSWLAIVNEFVMSCYDDDVEVEKRPPGLLENCRVLHASTLQHITEPTAFEDGKQYILCPTPSDFTAILRKHGLPVPSSEAGNDGGAGRDSERMSIATTDQLESLEELSYYFDDHGTLRHCATSQAVYELMSDESRAGEIDEIVKAAIFHIQMEMLAELDFKQAHVPLDPRPDEPKEARSSVFVTSDWRKNNNLLIVMNGGRGAQPGIWSRDLLIQEGLELGSMLPVFRRAKSYGFGVAVLNPCTNSVTVDGKLHQIRQNATPDEHALYVWDNIISRAQAQNVYILAYTVGAKLVTTLLQHREASVVRRLRAVVFAEGAYRLDPNSTSPMVGQFLRQRAINFKAESEVPVGHHIPSAEEQLLCSCLSVGDLSASSSDSRSMSSSTSKRSSSNKARTISLSLETTFTYFAAARDRKVGAPEFIAESETRTRSCLNMRRPVPTPSAASPTEPDPAVFDVEIGTPYDLKHDVHIRYNYAEARFEGVPDNFIEYLAATAATTRKKSAPRTSATGTSRSSLSGVTGSVVGTLNKHRTKRGRTGSDSSSDSEDTHPMALLNQHFQLHFRHVPRLVVEGYEDRIPAVLVMLQQHFMAKQGYLLPHIFRESPNKADRDQAMREINHGTFSGASHDVRVLADLIKVWFRELPVPILHQVAPDRMEQLARSENAVEELNQMLGSVERCVIVWLADLLTDVAEHQERNHMGLDQLAIVIAPNLVRIETENPMVAVTLSKAVVDLFRAVLHTRRSTRRANTTKSVADNPVAEPV
ncbi:TPA: hypothetical protein N0F65_000763 [Lagenidium giganteum]|uniref:Rho-GAP domain-containing protein n=1 Tax=Lagenidium giganteum TaxID=4803 RepID=A0AAV2ZQT7_9STRA|nr:TPA: hypothetical protein N0F65_000763 [Lagenidium giganteum]